MTRDAAGVPCATLLLLLSGAAAFAQAEAPAAAPAVPDTCVAEASETVVTPETRITMDYTASFGEGGAFRLTGAVTIDRGKETPASSVTLVSDGRRMLQTVQTGETVRRLLYDVARLENAGISIRSRLDPRVLAGLVDRARSRFTPLAATLRDRPAKRIEIDLRPAAAPEDAPLEDILPPGARKLTVWYADGKEGTVSASALRRWEAFGAPDAPPVVTVEFRRIECGVPLAAAQFAVELPPGANIPDATAAVLAVHERARGPAPPPKGKG